MRSTTVWGGAGVLLSGVLGLLGFFRVGFSLGGDDTVFFGSGILSVLPGVLLAAACVVLAFGARGEPGIVHGSALGKAALVVYGVGQVVLHAASLPLDGLDFSAQLALGRVVGALSLVVLAAGVVAAIVVVRAGVLRGFARWALVIVMAWEVCFTAVLFVPSVELAYFMAPWAGVVQSLLWAAAGVGYLLHGQREAIRQRAAAINRAW